MANARKTQIKIKTDDLSVGKGIVLGQSPALETGLPGRKRAFVDGVGSVFDVSGKTHMRAAQNQIKRMTDRSVPAALFTDRVNLQIGTRRFVGKIVDHVDVTEVKSLDDVGWVDVVPTRKDIVEDYVMKKLRVGYDIEIVKLGDPRKAVKTIRLVSRRTAVRDDPRGPDLSA